MGLKNIEKAQVLRLGDEVEYQQGQIVSKTLAQNAGESIVMPAHVPHAVYGQTRFKMLLTVIV